MNDSFVHVNLLTTSSQQANYNEISSDLADHISGLYRLLDLCNDEGSNGIGKFSYEVKLLEHFVK
jgi:hypothetical protein